MKKSLQKNVLAFMFLMLGFSFSPALALAQLDGYVSVDGNGNVGACIGSAELCGGGGGYESEGGWDISGNPYGLPDGNIMDIVSNLLFWLLALFAIFGVIGFVISGIWYLVSAGEESMAEKGKEGMKYSIIGIVIGLSGFLIMQAVNLMLGGVSSSY